MAIEQIFLFSLIGGLMEKVKVDGENVNAIFDKILDVISKEENRYPCEMKQKEMEQNAERFEMIDKLYLQAYHIRQVGTSIPSKPNLRGISGKLFVFVGNIFLKLSQVITKDISSFNNSLLCIVNIIKIVIQDIIRDYEKIKLDRDIDKNRINDLNLRQQKLERLMNEMKREFLERESELKKELDIFKNR